MPQKEFYVKHVTDASYTGLIDGGEMSYAMTGSDTEGYITTMLFDPDGINKLPDSATVNTISVQYRGKVDTSMSYIGCKFKRQVLGFIFCPDGYTIDGDVVTITGEIDADPDTAPPAITMDKFTSTQFKTQNTPDLDYLAVNHCAAYKQGLFVALWAYKNQNLFNNKLILDDVQLIIDYILPGYYIARISGVGMDEADVLQVLNPSGSSAKGLDIQLEQSKPAVYKAHSYSGRKISKIVCKDLDGELWTKTAEQLEQEGALTANRTDLYYTDTTTKHTEHEIVVYFEEPGSNVYLGNTPVDVYVGTTLVDVYVGTTLI